MPKTKSYDDLVGDGLQLRILFDEIGVNQKRFAEKIGVSGNTLTNWINSPVISTDNLIKIEKGLEVDISHKFTKLKQAKNRQVHPNVHYSASGEEVKEITLDEYIEYQSLKKEVEQLKYIVKMQEQFIAVVKQQYNIED